jgi:hypothetical protein
VELKAQVNDYKASVLIIDNISQCFGGDENNRHHVSFFLSGLMGLSERPLAVLILGHPSKAADSEYSGSTAWETAVRMRWYLGERLPDQKETEGEPDSTIRYLCKRKANYSRLDYRQLTYQEGVYACEQPESEELSMREKWGHAGLKSAAETLILNAVHGFFEAGQRVVMGGRSEDYIFRHMQTLKLCQDFTPQELQEALMRLKMSKRVVEIPIGRGANRHAKSTLGLAGSTWPENLRQ